MRILYELCISLFLLALVGAFILWVMGFFEVALFGNDSGLRLMGLKLLGVGACPLAAALLMAGLLRMIGIRDLDS